MPKLDSRLMYFLSETHYFSENYSIAIVGLVGSLTEQNASVLHECQEAVSRTSAKIIVLNFRDVNPTIDTGAIFLLATLLEAIRRKPAVLKLSGVHPSLRKMLEKKGLAKPEEFVGNLAEAFQALTQIRLSAA